MPLLISQRFENLRPPSTNTVFYSIAFKEETCQVQPSEGQLHPTGSWTLSLPCPHSLCFNLHKLKSTHFKSNNSPLINNTTSSIILGFTKKSSPWCPPPMTYIENQTQTTLHLLSFPPITALVGCGTTVAGLWSCMPHPWPLLRGTDPRLCPVRSGSARQTKRFPPQCASIQNNKLSQGPGLSERTAVGFTQSKHGGARGSKLCPASVRKWNHSKGTR